MIERCTPAEKQHMVDLIKEMHDVVANLQQVKGKVPVEDRQRVAKRLKEIGDEMKAFRKRYPLD